LLPFHQKHHIFFFCLATTTHAPHIPHFLAAKEQFMNDYKYNSSFQQDIDRPELIQNSIKV